MNLLRHQQTCLVALKWLFGAALLLGILLLLLAGCSKTPPPAPRPAFRALAQAMGDSMLPTFKSGDFVSVELCRFEDVGAGDTVIYWHEATKAYVHHRAVQRDMTGLWITRGDNNPTIDTGHMSSAQFVGRTTANPFQ